MKLFFVFNSRENKERLFHFFKHYRKIGVTEFYAIYHSYDEVSRDVLEYVMENSMVVRIMDGQFDERVKVDTINRVRLKYSDRDEWSFVVDCDEFVDINKKDLGRIMSSDANYVNFSLIDRFSEDGLGNITIEEDISDTFPLYSNYTWDVLRGTTTKVSLSRRDVILGLGHHDVIEQSEQIMKLKRFPYNGFIWHYKWVNGIIDESENRLESVLVNDGSNDDYRGELELLIKTDFQEVNTIKKPLRMKLLFIVWELQDLNLMIEFFAHYKGIGVTDFYCIYHDYGTERGEIYDYVSQMATIVNHWDEPYTTRREALLKNKYKREIADNEYEFIWTVDADEFVDVSTDFIREVLNSDANHVNGWMIDRFSPEGLIEPRRENVFTQFPIRSFYTRFKLQGSASKVTLSRAYVVLATGHHLALNDLSHSVDYLEGDQRFKDDRELVSYNPNEDEWIEVAHIKWHSKLLEEIYLKFNKTMHLCRYSATELGRFVLDYCYKKKSITEMIKEYII
jgi:hypothetical protein